MATIKGMPKRGGANLMKRYVFVLVTFFSLIILSVCLFTCGFIFKDTHEKKTSFTHDYKETIEYALKLLNVIPSDWIWYWTPFLGKTRRGSKRPENGNLFAAVCPFFVLGRFVRQNNLFIQKTGRFCPVFCYPPRGIPRRLRRKIRFPERRRAQVRRLFPFVFCIGSLGGNSPV